MSLVPLVPLAEVIDPGWTGVARSGLLVLATLVVTAWAGLRLVRLGLVATARTVVQLVAIGFVLEWVFSLESALAVTALLAAMTAVAGWTASGRVERPLRGTAAMLTLLFAVVLALTLLYVGEVVLGLQGPAPQYWIPLGGMILGNAMTAGALAAQRLHDEARRERERIVTALCLGASPAQAMAEIERRCVVAATTPIVNAMLIVGLVKLPGVMTGQMLGGSAPLVAARYQIVVMFMLLFGDTLTAVAIVRWLRRRAFTADWQPRL